MSHKLYVDIVLSLKDNPDLIFRTPLQLTFWILICGHGQLLLYKFYNQAKSSPIISEITQLILDVLFIDMVIYFFFKLRLVNL